ncbi:DUF4123 domain-containing protein [Limnohabitans sp. DM1]|uniref:DUF4123 domain-containing protein n=1 Tax=Limnohabitans sp. DM1 TaxID=1597955 RepID=UPI000B0FEBC4|nr:DUF4123 domain-containing protein [Limnohabitans sp. DM1]
MSQLQTSQQWQIEPWGLLLQQEHVAQVRQLAKDLEEARLSDAKAQAWLVLDGWQDNPAAAWLQEQQPDWVKTRQFVPDPAFSGMEALAPCLLPLHELNQASGQVLYLWHTLISLMWLDTQRRLVSHSVCGVLFTNAPVDDVLDHWLMLAHQVTPEGARRPLRHHDPRILQRLWPSLSADQRQAWLGPVHSYWQLQQPWGPCAPERERRAERELMGALVRWHKAARAPGTNAAQTSTLPVHRLLTRLQHLAIADSAAVNNAWKAMANAQVSEALQPTTSDMHHMCLQMNEWRSSHQPPWTDTHARQWLWCTWFNQNSATPHKATPKTPIDWRQSPWIDLSDELVRRLREEPDADFRTHFEELMSELSAQTSPAQP